MSHLAVTMPGWTEMLIILVIFVLLFGARKLPDLGSSIGQSIKNFKKGVSEPEAEEGVDGQAAPSDTTPSARDGQ